MVQIAGPLGLVHKYDISGGKYTCALSVGETGIEPEPPEKEGIKETWFCIRRNHETSSIAIQIQ